MAALAQPPRHSRRPRASPSHPPPLPLPATRLRRAGGGRSEKPTWVNLAGCAERPTHRRRAGEGLSTIARQRRQPLTFAPRSSPGARFAASPRSPLPASGATACTHLSGGIPPPPCGEDRLGRRPSEKGVAGHRAPYRRVTQSLQPQGPRPDGSLDLASAADVAAGRLRQIALCPAPPSSLGLRPSRSSPQGGRTGARRLCENPIGRRERRFAQLRQHRRGACVRASGLAGACQRAGKGQPVK